MARGGGHDSRFCDLRNLALREVDAICIFVEQTALVELTIGHPYSNVQTSITQPSADTFRIAVPIESLAKMFPDDFSRDDPNSEAIVLELFKDARLTIVMEGAKILSTNMLLSDDQTSASFTMDVPELILQSDRLPLELFAAIAVN